MTFCMKETLNYKRKVKSVKLKFYDFLNDMIFFHINDLCYNYFKKAENGIQVGKWKNKKNFASKKTF